MRVFFSFFFAVLLILLLPVDTGIGLLLSKTSLQHATFLHKLQASLPECVTFFRTCCLQRALPLLFDGDQRLGLLPPSMLYGPDYERTLVCQLTLDYKQRLKVLVKFNDTFGYTFFHTYAPDGTVTVSSPYS